jgi:hypothetical protein
MNNKINNKVCPICGRSNENNEWAWTCWDCWKIHNLSHIDITKLEGEIQRIVREKKLSLI